METILEILIKLILVGIAFIISISFLIIENLCDIKLFGFIQARKYISEISQRLIEFKKIQ